LKKLIELSTVKIVKNLVVVYMIVVIGSRQPVIKAWNIVKFVKVFFAVLI